MIADETPLFDRSHNLPAGMPILEQAVLEIKELLNERVQDGGKTFAERKAEFLRSAGNVVVRNRDTAGAAADVVKLAGRVWDKIHAARMERSQPYRDVADALGRAVADFWDEVAEAMDGVRGKIDAWSAEEDLRIAQQQREQDEEMERLRSGATPAPVQAEPLSTTREHIDYSAPAPRAQTATAPTPAKRRKIRGDYGAIVSATEVKTYIVADVRALPDYILNAPAVHEAIIAAVKGTVKVMGVPPGIATTTNTANQIR